ncbi:Fe-S cluster assembly protein SufD [Aliibacillus thermotolerans]|uniref:Fe-S cluster assembly protein SufD n=1 Tax=Aliibacillus thermotolerans TaxID=1834418 RepID=A0ABW0U8P6_9BACI|nr:Fe-S cluster assembly protein SufD [Aliibacillus thermotolerans]MDA3129661.1 Fe-S cluster assembly protein SufD [Aliibacillus thermotolerans]
MSVDTKWTFDEKYVKEYSQRRGEPEWLTEERLLAVRLAEKLELPKPEKTNIKTWNFTSFKHDVTGDYGELKREELPEEVRVLLDRASEGENILVLRDGKLVYRSISERLKEQGVLFVDIETAAKEHGDLLKQYFMSHAVDVDENKLTAHHVALMNGGVFVYVPKNVEMEEPLQTIYWQEDPEAAIFNHVTVVAEDNSQVTYLENYVSFSEQDAVANIISEVYAKPGANISYGGVDHFEKGMTTSVIRRGYAEKDATIKWALGQMNEGNTLSDNTTILKGDGANADAKAVSVGRGKQSQNFLTHIVHHGKHTDGQILTHAVMKDEASSIFNGVSKIEKGATKSNGEQTERVLMLSERARGDANPILLIDEDDVTAGHAASVGQIDPMQMFYLMSRGISEKEAERLIIHGFLAPVVDQLPLQAVRERLTEVIERKVQ